MNIYTKINIGGIQYCINYQVSTINFKYFNFNCIKIFIRIICGILF